MAVPNLRKVFPPLPSKEEQVFKPDSIKQTIKKGLKFNDVRHTLVRNLIITMKL